MRFTGLLLSTCLIWSSQAVAGFEWVPPKPNPSEQKTLTPQKKSSNKANESQNTPPAQKDAPSQDEVNDDNEDDTPSPEEMVNRIFDYESGKISAKKMEDERDQRIEKIKEIRKTIKQRELEVEIKKRDKQLRDQAKLIKELKEKTAPEFSSYKIDRPSVGEAVIPPIPKVSKSSGLEQIEIDPTEKPVIGFGSQMPLALAVSDIIPDNYSFSFGAGTDPGMLVSWDGYHRPWSIVLAEMLNGAHLVANVNNKNIEISLNPERLKKLPPMLNGPRLRSTLSLNPMPAPKAINFKQNSNLSPFVSAQQNTSKPTSLLAPIAQTKTQRLKIESFPLGRHAIQTKNTQPTTTPNQSELTPVPGTPITPPMLQPLPKQDAPHIMAQPPAIQQPPSHQTHGVYISRKQSQSLSENKDKNIGFFNLIPAIKEFLSFNKDQKTDIPSVNIVVPPSTKAAD